MRVRRRIYCELNGICSDLRNLRAKTFMLCGIKKKTTLIVTFLFGVE